MAPEAIHIDNKKMNKFDRPPSSDSLRKYMPEVPFEHRKFSVDSLKANEMFIAHGSKGSEASGAESVGYNDHPNETNKYMSKILIVSDKRDRSESCHAQTPSHQEQKLGSPQSDPRLDIQLQMIAPKNHAKYEPTFEKDEQAFIEKMKLMQESVEYKPTLEDLLKAENEAMKQQLKEMADKLEKQ